MKNDMEEYEDEIQSIYKTLCGIKTRLLEIQCAALEGKENTEDVESVFDDIDSYLQKAKEQMFDLTMNEL